MSNQSAFEAASVVEGYALDEQLQKPEETILAILGASLPHMRMLDIGVGGGRTTVHCAHLVKDYVAVDYSSKMIEACRNKFPALAERGALHVCNAASMSIFDDGAFDFVLFSYNGLDYLSHEDRLKALAEMKRVCSAGGLVCFSSHNLNTDLEFHFRKKLTWNPLKLAIRVGYYFLFKFFTRHHTAQRQTARWAIINDGAHRFRMWTYYITASEQIRQLDALGFKDIRVFGLSDGREITGQAARLAAKDSWLYYLCRA